VTYRVVIQPSAAADIDAAYVWVNEQAPDASARWFNGLEAAIYSLEHFPERCPLAEESRAFTVTIRQLVYGKRVGTYRILFTVTADAVHVLHVRHGRRRRIQRRRKAN
jgi:plasmid stabilization system protein ParE